MVFVFQFYFLVNTHTHTNTNHAGPLVNLELLRNCTRNCTSPSFPDSAASNADLCSTFLPGHVQDFTAQDCMISGQTRYCFPTNVSSCITDSCGILEQQCLYEISLDDCEPSEEGDELAFLKETSRMVTEALNFNTNDMQSENQIETIFTRLEPNFCGIGINEDFLSTYGHVFGWAYPGPSFFVQQSTIGSRCNSLSSNTYVHELGKLCSHHHSA